VNTFSPSMHIYAFYNDFSALRAVALCSNRFISGTTASIGMCDTPLESLFYGVRGGKLFRAEAISTQRERPTAIAVPLVYY